MPARPTEPAGFNCLGKRSQPDSIPGRWPGDRSGFNSCKEASRVQFQAGGQEIGPGSIRARELAGFNSRQGAMFRTP